MRSSLAVHCADRVTLFSYGRMLAAEQMGAGNVGRLRDAAGALVRFATNPMPSTGLDWGRNHSRPRHGALTLGSAWYLGIRTPGFGAECGAEPVEQVDASRRGDDAAKGRAEVGLDHMERLAGVIGPALTRQASPGGVGAPVAGGTIQVAQPVEVDPARGVLDSATPA